VTVFGSHVRAEVHARGIHPAEKRFVRLSLPLDKIDGGCRSLVIDRFHALLIEGTRVLNCLLTDLSPSGMHGRIVTVRRLATQNAAWAEPVTKAGIARIEPVLRVFFCIEVVKIAVELIEAVHCRQIFVAIAEVVLAELPGGVTERLE